MLSFENSSGEIIDFTIVLTKMEVIVRGLIMGKLKEEKTIEFKQVYSLILKTVSAFANY